MSFSLTYMEHVPEPEVVKKLLTGNITTTSISLSWGKPEGNARFYSIQILGEPTFITTVTTTFGIINGLTPGNYYTLLVSVFVGEKNITGNSAIVWTYTKPEVVKNLSIGFITTNSISLSWEKPDGNASFYNIQVLGEPSLNRSVIATSATFEGLMPGNYYVLLVSAVAGENNIAGNSVNVWTYTKPEVVKNLLIGVITINSISLSWDKPDGNASFFNIQILGEPSLNRSVITTSAKIEGLIPGNYYSLLVSAVAGENNIAGSSSNIGVYTKPEVVKNLQIGVITINSISLSWDKPDGNASFYNIQILGEPSLNRNVMTTSATIEGLIPGNYYVLFVSSVGAVPGNSVNVWTYTKPEIVENLQVVNVTNTSVSLKWEKPNGNASRYLIKRADNAVFRKIVFITSVTIGDLLPGYNYTFMISALVDNSVEGEMKLIYAYTKPGAVKNLTPTNINSKSITLSWKPPDGVASAYQIQISGNLSSTNYTSLNTNYTIGGLSPGIVYRIVVSALVSTPYIQGEGTETVVKTNSHGLILRLNYLSSDVNSRTLIINKINDILKEQFPNQNVTAT
ncbi:receptor-type tyrosine-protein phosphatase eta-like [Engystomops pustulosus]